MNESEINDIRTTADFKGISFSNFKRTEVKLQLLENMKTGKVEPACYWGGELICSGHSGDIWEIVLHFLGKYIHLANPKIILYIENRYNIFDSIINERHYIKEIDLRNNDKIRRLFAEIITILTISGKKPSFELLKMNYTEEFNVNALYQRFKAPSTKYVENIFKPKDPQELFIALNEFAYHLSPDSKNITEACYWLEWILEFDFHCKKKKSKCVAEKRIIYPVDMAFYGEIIWIIWDILILYSSSITLINKLMMGLSRIYCINYTIGANKRRRHLLYYAISLVTEKIHEPLPDFITNKNIVETVLSKVENIYKQIKCNEITPNAEYLFSNLNDNSNKFKDMIRKIEIINSFKEL